MLRQKLEPYKITPPQFAVLSFLWEREGINQIQLGELMDVDNATISGILDRLEKVGYVRREKNIEDRRSFSLAITEEGKKIRHELKLLSMEHYKNLTKNITEEEFNILVKLLNKLRSK